MLWIYIKRKGEIYMNEALYLDDMYLKEFDAEVTSVKDGKYITLNQTAFYPKSGGVDGDEGIFLRNEDEFRVIYTGKFGGEISHEVDKPGLKTGDKIRGIVDWDRRYKLMRYHTAAHVISGVFYQNLGGIKITGNNLSVEKGRIDFNLEDFDRTLIEEQIEKSNNVILNNHQIKVYNIDRAELDTDKTLMRLAVGLPKSIRTVRIVDITGFDRQPDGGAHVKSTTEIGKITLQKLVNKGKSNRRLYFTIE